MRKILIITPHFPSLDYYSERSQDPRTKFLLDYAESWVRQGHQVRVIHLPPRYPKIFNWFATFAGGRLILQTLQLSRFIQNLSAICGKTYSHDGIKIVRHPISKNIPHRAPPQRQIRRLASYFSDLAESENWQADVILADYLTPSLPIAIGLSPLLQASIFPIIHQTDLRYFLQSPQAHLPALGHCKAILFRSAPMVERFKKAGLANMHHDFVYSGLPDDIPAGLPRRNIKRLLYVGTLRKTKNIHEIFYALADLRKEHPEVELDLIGGGEYENALRSLVDELGLVDCVKFIGKIPHEEVFEYMRQADALVMVSRETFGMVYIEAMLQGCVVVAAKDEGIDGIVINNYNGYLTPLHDQQELTKTLRRILTLPPEETTLLSGRAIQTANEMRNDLLARNLLDRLYKYRDSSYA